MTAAPEKAIEKPDSQDFCFVIMPFNELMDVYYNVIYLPAINDTGLISKRVDEIYKPNAIIKDIWESTLASKVILADLTDNNPNVLYELGLAHAKLKPAILITNNYDSIPFDLRHIRVIQYNYKIPGWDKKLREEITLTINEVMKSPKDSTLDLFLTKKDESEGKITEYDKEIIEMKQKLSMLQQEIFNLNNKFYSPGYQVVPMASASPYSYPRTDFQYGSVANAGFPNQTSMNQIKEFWTGNVVNFDEPEPEKKNRKNIKK